MNVVVLKGRLSTDVTERATQSTTVANFSIAVDRYSAGTKSCDFIKITTFGKTAETAIKYLVKGSEVAIKGRINTGSYTNKDGQKVYTTDIVADEIDFCGSREKDVTLDTVNKMVEEDFMKIPEGSQESLPFI